MFLFYLLSGVFHVDDYSYGEELLKDVVYLGFYNSDYKTLEDALNNVSDGGTIFVRYNSKPYLSSSIDINKNVRIIGIPDQHSRLPAIIYDNKENNIKSPSIRATADNFLEISNLHIQPYLNKTLLESQVPNLILENLYINYGSKIFINDPLVNSPMNLLISNCNFVSITTNILFDTSDSGTISFDSNKFEKSSLNIRNNDSTFYVANNSFYGGGVNILEDSFGLVKFEDNSFKSGGGYGYVVISSASSKDIEFTNNIFPQSRFSLTNTDTNYSLDLNDNWWGTPQGPHRILDSTFAISGTIDLNSWALREDFDSFYKPFEVSGRVSLHNCINHSGVKVSLICDNMPIESTLTDSSGYFYFNSVEANVYTLTFEYQGFEALNLPLDYIFSDTENLSPTLFYKEDYLDLNGDGILDELDLYILLDSYGQFSADTSWELYCDLNRDGKIDIFDLILFSRFRGHGND